MTKVNLKSNKNQLEKMIASLRERILTGKHKVGEFLPSEKTLSKQFKISNLTVREGLEVLVSERLIEKIPRVGSRVLDASQHGIINVRFAYHETLIREAVLLELLDEFQRLYPHIHVQPSALGYVSYLNYFEMMETLIDEQSIDIFTINYNEYRAFKGNQGTRYFETLEDRKTGYSFLTEIFSDGAELKVQPFIFSPLILCYNREHFKELQIEEPDSSWRWSDLFHVADQLAIENERLGFYSQMDKLNRWVVFLIQSGAVFERGKDGKIIWTSKGMIDAIRAVREIVMQINRHPILLSGNDVAEELFLEGKVSMIMTTYFGLNKFKAQDIPFNIAPLPYLQKPVTTLQSIGLGVLRHSQVKESAKLLLEYLSSYEAQLLIRQKTYSIPAHKMAAEWTGKETLIRPSRFSLYREIIPNYRLYTDLDMTERELISFEKAVRLFWSGLEQEGVLLDKLKTEV